MKRKLVKLECAMLSVMLLLPNMLACSGAKTPTEINNETVGIYVENEVTPENLGYCRKAPVLMEDGSLVLYAKEGNYAGELFRYVSTDGGDSWNKIPIDFEDEDGFVMNIAAAKDGSCVFDVYYPNEEMTEMLDYRWFVLENDKISEVEVPEEVTIPVNGFEIFDSQTILFYGSDDKNENYTYVYNHETKDLKRVELDSYVYGTTVNNFKKTVLLTTYTESTQKLYEVNKDAVLQLLVSDLQAQGSGSTDSQGAYYYVFDGNILRIAPNGSLKEQIMDNNNFLLGLEEYYCEGITYVSDRSFLVLLTNFSANTYKLIKYSFDEEAKETVSNQIVVWCASDSASLRYASRAFSKENKGAAVKFIFGLEEYGDSMDNARQALNASLISRECPDVIVLDGLDYMNMAEKGYFEDLSKDIDTSVILPNIIEPFYMDGGLYVVPTRFSIPVLLGDDLDKNPILTLEDLKEAILSRPVRPNMDLTQDEYYADWDKSQCYGIGVRDITELVNLALSASSGELIKNGSLDEGNLERVMDFIVDVGKYYHMENYPETGPENYMCYSSDDCEMVYSDLGEYEYNCTHHAYYGWGNMTCTSYLGSCVRNLSLKDSTGDVSVFPGLATGAFTPRTVVAVPANSKNKELAVDFINTLLSEGIQGYQDERGLPCLEAILLEKVEKYGDYVKEHGYKGDIMEFYRSLETPIHQTEMTQVLRDSMVIHATETICGRENYEEALDQIKQDMYLVLEEKK